MAALWGTLGTRAKSVVVLLVLGLLTWGGIALISDPSAVSGGGSRAPSSGPVPAAGPIEKPSPGQVALNAEDNAREVCATIGPKGVASEFGGSATDPASAAQAFAEKTYRAEVVANAVRGCLKGFDEHGP